MNKTDKPGIEFIKQNNIGLEVRKEASGNQQDQKNQQDQQKVEDAKTELIKKWLLISKRGIAHSEDPRRGGKNLERIKKYFYSQFVPTLDTFPRDEYKRVQDVASLALGQGKITDRIPLEQINQGINVEIGNIKESLDPWIEYFTSGDSSSFPIWAKYWAFMGVVRMSGKMEINEIDGKISFPKRSKDTISGFPELNREALGKAVDYIVERIENKKNLDKALSKTNFSGVYALYLNEQRGEISEREMQITEGTWIKYNQGNNPETTNRLVESLEGKFTNWCTAGRSTAESQLAGGNFYVYYSNSESNKPNPRIAIRCTGNTICEIRGVWGTQQNLDKYISGTDILKNKLSEFGNEGERYKVKSENMRRVTEIYNSLRKDNKYQLKNEDVVFLKSRPEGFGYTDDPRIKEILSFSELLQKYRIAEIDETAVDAVISGGDYDALISCVEFINPKLQRYITQKLIEVGCNIQVIEKIYNNFSGLNKREKMEVVNNWINFKPKFNINLRFLKSANGLTLPSSVGGELNLINLTTVEGLTLPRSVGGDLYLTDLTSPEGLTLPRSVGGNLNLYSLISDEGLIFPESIGGKLYLNKNTSPTERERIKKLFPSEKKIWYV